MRGAGGGTGGDRRGLWRSGWAPLPPWGLASLLLAYPCGRGDCLQNAAPPQGHNCHALANLPDVRPGPVDPTGSAGPVPGPPRGTTLSLPSAARARPSAAVDPVGRG